MKLSRARRKALVRRARFLASRWIDADIASADCWDGYSDDEYAAIAGELRRIAERLLVSSAVPEDGDDGTPKDEQ